MSWRLGNSIRSRYETGLQLWRTEVLTRAYRGWENIKGNSKPQPKRVSVHELKQHKPWLDEECLHFLDQRK